jgi:hypothetical protein
MELSVDCLKEILTVSGLLPDPLPQAVRVVAARERATRGTRRVSTAVRRGLAAVGRTGTTSYGLTAVWPGRMAAR